MMVMVYDIWILFGIHHQTNSQWLITDEWNNIYFLALLSIKVNAGSISYTIKQDTFKLCLIFFH